MEKKNGLLDDGKCDVDDEEDDYETAFLKYLDSEEKRSSVSQSSCLENKNLKTHVTGSSLPPLLDTQSSSYVPNYLSSSYLPHKKHNFDAGIVMSNSTAEGERSGRDDDIKKPKKPIIGDEGEAKEEAQILEKKTREAVLNWPDDKRRARTAKYFKKKNIASVSYFSGLSEKGSGKGGYRDDTSEEEMSDDDPDYVPGDTVDSAATYSKKKKPKSSVSCFPRVSQRRNGKGKYQVDSSAKDYTYGEEVSEDDPDYVLEAMLNSAAKSSKKKNPESSSVSCVPHSSQRRSGKGEYRYKTFGEDDISGEDVSDDDPEYAPGDKVNLAPTYSKKKKNKKTAEKKINSTEQESPPELAFETRDKIISMGGTDLKLIIQKPLNESDWLNGERRLSIPINQTIPTYFLTDEEKGKLGTKQENAYESEIEVELLAPNGESKRTSLRILETKNKDSGKISPMFVLVKNWERIVSENQLQIDDVIQLWSFRVDSKLCFALVKVEDEGNNNRGGYSH